MEGDGSIMRYLHGRCGAVFDLPEEMGEPSVRPSCRHPFLPAREEPDPERFNALVEATRERIARERQQEAQRHG